MKISYLRTLMMIDAAVLFWLGALLIIAPKWIENVFHFPDLPPGVNYLLGLWGCIFVTMGFGYAVAAQNPIRHRVWIQMGIARGSLECLLGIIYLLRGVVTFSQAWLGIVLAGLIALAYLVLYPRRPRLADAPGSQTSPRTS